MSAVPEGGVGTTQAMHALLKMKNCPLCTMDFQQGMTLEQRERHMSECLEAESGLA